LKGYLRLFSHGNPPFLNGGFCNQSVSPSPFYFLDFLLSLRRSKIRFLFFHRATGSQLFLNKGLAPLSTRTPPLPPSFHRGSFSFLPLILVKSTLREAILFLFHRSGTKGRNYHTSDPSIRPESSFSLGKNLPATS